MRLTHVFMHAALATSLAALPSRAQKTSPDDLVALRTQVEHLAQTLAAEREEHDHALRALRAQKAQLELELAHERIRRETLTKVQEAQRLQSSQEEAHRRDLTEPTRQAFALLRAHIRRSLPFRPEERLGAVDTIETQWQSGDIDATTALERLWQMVLDERDLLGEVALHQQVIAWEGQRRWVDVVHVGSAFLFFRTPEGAYGHVQGTAESPRPALLPEAHRAAARDLFAALESRRRSGPVTLPLSPAAVFGEAP